MFPSEQVTAYGELQRFISEKVRVFGDLRAARMLISVGANSLHDHIGEVTS
jgi:hypothetical protein